jgi:hypothetical protein
MSEVEVHMNFADRRTTTQRWLSALIIVVVVSCVVSIFIHKTRVFGAERKADVDSTLRDVTSTLDIGGAKLQLVFTGAVPDLPIKSFTEYLHRAAQAVASYYGRFPVPAAKILIVVEPGQDGILQGTTWGDRDGFPAFIRLRIGQHTTARELDEDWTATHEMVHTALPSLPDDQHWLEEGLATYVEPIARAQVGQLTPEEVWYGMLLGMPHGEPGQRDRGLDYTHTWGRTYWGGALFCLVADIQLRKQTKNAYGLQDALRAVVNAGGGIDKDWSIERVLAVADGSTGTSVLKDLYKTWGSSPVAVDLPELWKGLGVQLSGDQIVFDGTAPFARIREDITTHKGIKQVVLYDRGH